MEKKIAKTKTDTAKKVNKTKKTVKKTVRKTLKKVQKEKQVLNETVNLSKQIIDTKATEAVGEINTAIAENFNKVECVHCHRYFDKGLTICPYCRKSQKDNKGPIIITILALVLLLCITGSYLVDKFLVNPVDSTEYKSSCNLVSYEELVRNAKNYKNKNIKVIGKVVSVTGSDTEYGNIMTISINTNLFDDTTEQLMTIDYTDHKYNQGFIKGDLIAVYGEFSLINGNTPEISAKYIEFEK